MILTSVKYLLFVVSIEAPERCDRTSLSDCTNTGYEQMQTVSNKEHNDRLSCLVEKAEYKDTESRIIFFCGKGTEYFNKQQKLY